MPLHNICRSVFACTAFFSLPFCLLAEFDSSGPKHFIYFERSRERITDAEFLHTAAIAGAQLKYTWRELEAERDRYKLSLIGDDLTFLEEHHRRLFIQVQDVSFDEEKLVPE